MLPAAVLAGETIVHSTVLAQTTELALALPKKNRVVPVPSMKPVPVTVTGVPPATGPPLGATLVTVGVKLKRLFVVGRLVLLTFVMRMCVFSAALTSGAVAVIMVFELTVNFVAGVEPNVTVLTAANSVPVITTVTPPAMGEDLTDSFVTVGGPSNV